MWFLLTRYTKPEQFSDKPFKDGLSRDGSLRTILREDASEIVNRKAQQHLLALEVNWPPECRSLEIVAHEPLVVLHLHERRPDGGSSSGAKLELRR